MSRSSAIWLLRCLLSGLFSLLALGGCQSRAIATAPGAEGGTLRNDASLSSAQDGQDTYLKLCAVCHGADGTGYRADNAPSLVSKTFLESATDAQLRHSIVHGRPGTAMAGYGSEVGGPLDATALNKLLAFLRSRGPQPIALPRGGCGRRAAWRSALRRSLHDLPWHAGDSRQRCASLQS